MILLHIVTFILSERGYFTEQLRDGRHKILELKEYFLCSLVHYEIIRMKFMDQDFPVHIAKDELLI